LGTCPDRCGACCPVRKSKRAGPTDKTPPPAFCTAQDHKLTGILTGAAPDCTPLPGGTSPTLGGSVIAVKPSRRGGWQGGAAVRLLAKLHQNVHQNIIFEVMSEVQKDLEDISAEIGTFDKK
jgi:hypothetical protein